MEPLSRRQLLAAGAGVAGAAITGGFLAHALPLLDRGDLVPGAAPTAPLEPNAWTTTADRVSFAVLGDNGSGGRQAMAVARQMATTYAAEPFEHVALLGDISYYGSIGERFADVLLRPMQPLIDAGVGFELAIGNHDGALFEGRDDLASVEASLRSLGTPDRYFSAVHGPAEVFSLDAREGRLLGDAGQDQRDWLDAALAASASRWKIVALHRPLHSSGTHGPTEGLAEQIGPILAHHAVDLVLAGHDHHYERFAPIEGVTHVVSGGGCRMSPVGRSHQTVVAASTLQFLHVAIDGDRLLARSIRPGGDEVDRFELRAREGS